MGLIELDAFHAEGLYEMTFDEMISTFKPLKDKDDKRYIKVHKYPIIFAILPSAMKRGYQHLSRASIQIYATRLGLSKLSHNYEINELIHIYEEMMFNTSSENIGLNDLFRHKITYNYKTPTSNNSCTYLSTTEEVKSYISEHGDVFGISDYQLALAMFFIGIQDANLTEYHKSLVQQEVELFWKIFELKKKQFQ